MNGRPNEKPGLIDRLLGRRSHYRESGPFLERFVCRAVDWTDAADDAKAPSEHDERWARLDLVDCSFGGAGLVVPPDASLVVAVDRALLLRFRDEASRRTYDVRALVRSCSDDKAAPLRIGVSFEDLTETAEDFDPDCWRLFNRRRAYRSAFAEGEATARLLAPGVSLDVPVTDLSVAGTCCVLDEGTMSKLRPDADQVVLVSGVPDLNQRPRIVAAIRHATPTTGRSVEAYRLGLAWRGERTRDWEEVRSAIARVVDVRMRRERARE